MTEKQTEVITINDKEYEVGAMTDFQKVLLTHIQDLTNKINNVQFNLDQLVVSKDAFILKLKADLNKED